jgi:hypothetical protein
MALARYVDAYSYCLIKLFFLLDTCQTLIAVNSFVFKSFFINHIERRSVVGDASSSSECLWFIFRLRPDIVTGV